MGADCFADPDLKKARADFAASAASIRKSRERLPLIAEHLGSHERQLEDLETRLAQLRQDITGFVIRTSSFASPAAPTALKGSASGQRGSPFFGAGHALQQVHDYESHDFDSHIDESSHGHYLPKELTETRASFLRANDFAKKLGGRVISLDVSAGGVYIGDDEGALACLMVEPMGKVLSPSDFETTGLVVCIQLEDSEQHQEEWEEILKETKWLDMGISFAIPYLHLHSGSGLEVQALEASIRALLEMPCMLNLGQCLLLGKGGGAALAVDLVTRGTLGERISGALLVAPGEVPEDLLQTAQEVEDPPALLLVWARDDEVAEFKHSRSWINVLNKWRSPSIMKDIKSGGHDLTLMLKYGGKSGGIGEAASAFVYFAIAALLCAEISRFIERIGACHSNTADGLPERTVRLLDELPLYLAGMLGSSSCDEGCIGLAVAQQSRGPGAADKLRGLLKQLQNWMNGGLRQVASASE